MFTRWNAPLSASDVVHSYNNDGKMLRSMAWTIINYINAVCPQVHVNLRRRHTIWKMAHHQHHLYHLNECVPYVSIAQWEWEKWERGCSIVLFGFHSSTIRPDAGRMNKWWWWWWLQIATMTLKTKAASGHNGKEPVKGRATNREKNDEILSNEHEWPEKQKMFRPHQTSGIRHQASALDSKGHRGIVVTVHTWNGSYGGIIVSCSRFTVEKANRTQSISLNNKYIYMSDRAVEVVLYVWLKGREKERKRR